MYEIDPASTLKVPNRHKLYRQHEKFSAMVGFGGLNVLCQPVDPTLYDNLGLKPTPIY